MKSLLLFFIVLIGLLSDINSQTQYNDTINQIDLRIKQSTTECTYIDTLFAHGKSIFFKKYIGFIKFRTGKGGTVRITLLCDSNLISQSISSTEFKKNKKKHDISKYYFLDNELVKYENFYFWRKDSDDSLMHKIIVYFRNNEIIEKEITINDTYKFNRKVIEQILINSNEIRNSIKPSS